MYLLLFFIINVYAFVLFSTNKNTTVKTSLGVFVVRNVDLLEALLEK